MSDDKATRNFISCTSVALFKQLSEETKLNLYD